MWGLRIHGYALAFLLCFFTLTAVSQRTDPSEVKALRDIKKSLIDPMDKLRNWNKGDPCTANWTGVWCFDRLGLDGYLHVRQLYLMTANLSGSLAPELGQLSHLEIMNFMWNNLTGTIPKEIGMITSLTLLLLNGNKLSGSLPDELGNLSNLNRLQVDYNQLSGPVPESLANLANVRHLHMNNNSFSGQLPAKLSNLSTVLHLLLDNNNLSGYLPPEFSKLRRLAILQLDNNNFSGNGIPSSYVNLPSLVKLSLRNCSLQGAIPDLGSIPKLRYLDLSWNQFSGPIPSNKLANNMTTVDLSNNKLNGSIPHGFVYPRLQRLALGNNLLSGSIPATMWQNISFSRNAKLTIDLRNNLLSDILGNLNPPANVTLRISGNPVCKNSNIQSVGQYCVPEGDEVDQDLANSKNDCPIQACPVDNFFEYAPSSPTPCFCAAPIRIGYRLKSPSFSYFPPYETDLESYITESLNLNLYQLSIDSYEWEEGPRLRMYLKIFPSYNDSHNNTFNISEVRRINGIFASWRFRRTDFFGPYELLNVTLLGPYANISVKLGRLSVGTAKPARNGIEDLLSSAEGGKHDYDWLLTPPGTPGFPSSEGESQPTLAPPRRSLSRSTSTTKSSRLSVSQSENNNPSRPARSSSVTRSSISNSQPQYNNYSSNKSPSTILNTSSASVSSYIRPSSRPSSPVTRSTSSARPSTPSSRPTTSRPSTPSRVRSASTTSSADKPRPTSQSSRPSTPSSRPQVAANLHSPSAPPTRSLSRPSTPTRRSSIPSLSPSPTSSTTSAGRVSLNGRSSAPASRPSSPSPRVRPPPQPVVPPDFPLDTPPNLRTTLPDRPVSAGRSRPGASTMKGNSSESQASVNMPRRQSSPIVNRGRLTEPASRSRGYGNANGHHADVPETRRAQHTPEVARRSVKASTTATDNTGFGRTISKKSLDMAIKHMDIRNGSGNLRSLSNTTLFPQSIRNSTPKSQSHHRASSAPHVDMNGRLPNNTNGANFDVGNGFNRSMIKGRELDERQYSAKLSEVDIYESSRYDALLLKEDLKNTNWLLSADDKCDQGPLFDNGFEHLPEPFGLL